MHPSSPFSQSFPLVHIEVRHLRNRNAHHPTIYASARQGASWVLRVAPGHDIRSPSTCVLQRFRPLVEWCRATAAFHPSVFVVSSLCLQSAQLATAPVANPPFGGRCGAFGQHSAGRDGEDERTRGQQRRCVGGGGWKPVECSQCHGHWTGPCRSLDMGLIVDDKFTPPDGGTVAEQPHFDNAHPSVCFPNQGSFALPACLFP
jgi:hypothetical protein